jgi:hypothetical protein
MSKITLEKQKYFFAKNHCEIQLCTILVCALYSIKYCTHYLCLSLSLHISCSLFLPVLLMPHNIFYLS